MNWSVGAVSVNLLHHVARTLELFPAQKVDSMLKTLCHGFPDYVHTQALSLVSLRLVMCGDS